MRRAGIRLRLVTVFGAGRGTFTKFFQLGAQSRELLVQYKHGLVLLCDMALEPGEAFLKAVNSFARHGARDAQRGAFPAQA